MSLPAFMSRRAAVGVIAAGALFCSAVPAVGDPAPRPPNCSAADAAGVAAGVATALTTYLYTHPDVNGFYTGLQDQPKDQIGGEVQDYFPPPPPNASVCVGVGRRVHSAAAPNGKGRILAQLDSDVTRTLVY